MELRYWLTEALTGTIGPEVRVQGTPTLQSRFGGGTMKAELMLGHLRTLDGALDRSAVKSVLSWADGGRYSITVTYGTACAGEWLIWRTDPVEGNGPVTVNGFELDGYPSFRSLNDNYISKDHDQLTMASRLLRDAFYSYQPFAVTVPWTLSPGGRRRDVDYPSHTAYYGDVLDEISSPDDGFQWRVTPRVVWQDHRPLRVERRVEFGEPTLRRPSDVRLEAGRDDGAQGNLLAFPRPARDFSKYAQSMYGWGRGEGAKKKWVGLSDPTLTNQGFLIVTKNVDFPNLQGRALTAATRGALSDAQQLNEPVQPVVLADKVPAIPAVGDVVSVQVGQCAAWPDGYAGSMQVGQVDLAPHGNHLETFTMRAI